MHRLVHRLARLAGGVVAGVALAVGAAPAEPGQDVALPAGVTRHAEVEGITEYRLANGLKILLMPDAGKPTATVNITYLVGSQHENYGETGMAHLLEHMLFRGTPTHPSLDAEFNRRGMRSNASTSLDRTNFFEQFEVRDDNLHWAIRMEADRMLHSTITRKDLDSEMTVVRNEFELGENSPENVMLKRMQSVAFDWHGYGRATIGNRSDIEHVSVEHLRAFYHQYYQPDNAVLLVAGKFDVRQTLAWITTEFGAIPKPSRRLPVLWTEEPVQDGERQFIVRRKGDSQLVMVGYKVPAALHPDSNALLFAADMLTGDPNGRLHKALVDEGLAVSVFSSSVGGLAPGLLILGAEVKTGADIDAARDALIETVEGLAKEPPAKDELERLQRADLNDVEKTVADPESLGLELSEAIALGDWRYFFMHRDLMQAVTVAQVADAAGHYFKRDNRVVGMFIPEDHPQRVVIPAAPAMQQVMRRFSAGAAPAPAEAFDPNPDNIAQRTTLLNVGGLRVALVPKTNKGATVTVAMDLHWGDAQSLNGKRTISDLTGEMLMRGSQTLNRDQLLDQFSRLKINGDTNHFETTRDHLPDALALIADLLKYPAFDPDEFAQQKAQDIAGIESQRSDPASLAADALRKHFNHYPRDDWRAELSDEEMVVAISGTHLEDLIAFHANFFGASHGELAIVGDFDVNAARKAILDQFGSWPSWPHYERVDEDYAAIPAVRIDIDTPDRENGVYLARANLHLAETDPDYPAMELANYMLGGGAELDSRLMVRLRQKMGLSYGGGSELHVEGTRGAAWLQIEAIAAPQNLDQVAAAVHEELERLVTQGFANEEVSRAKSGFLQQAVQSRAQDGELAEQWIKHLNLGRDFNWTREFESAVRALTSDQVNRVFRKLVKPVQFTVVVARDRAKVGQGGAKK